MPRDVNGLYSLPSGNPVSNGTIIDATWANNTLNDLASAMTGSLSRSGQGGMLAALPFVDGSETAPGITFTNETSSGLYRAGAGDVRITIQGGDVVRIQGSGLTISFDDGATWVTPAIREQANTFGGKVTVSSGGVEVTAGGLLVDAGGANITGGLTVDGTPFITGVLPSLSGNASKFLFTNGTTTSWANSVTATGSNNGFSAVGGTGTSSGLAGQAGTASGFGIGGLGTLGGLGGFFLSSATNVDVIRADGYITLAGATNPSSTTGFANRITPKNLIKAWGRIHCDGIGGLTVLDGFNIASVTAPGGNIVHINFATAMANANYATLLTMGPLSSNANLAGVTGAIAAGSVEIQVINSSTLGALNPASTNMDINIIVMATQ